MSPDQHMPLVPDPEHMPPAKPSHAEPENVAGEPGWFPVTRDDFDYRMDRVDKALSSIDRHVRAVEKIATQLGETIVSSAQDVINAVAAELQQEDSDLNSAVTAIQNWIASQPASVDVSALQPLADQLAQSVQNVANLVPATPPASS